MLTFCVSHASLLATSTYRPVAARSTLIRGTRACLRSVSLSAVAPEGLAFESLSSLRPELLAGTQRLGYTALTDIQERALPPALAGRDVVGKAKTGSGKTVVFGLALLQRLDMRMSSAGRPQALVLSPTRELAQQLVGAVRGLAVGLDGTRVVAVTGGAISRQQRDAIAVCHTRLKPWTSQVSYSRVRAWPWTGGGTRGHRYAGPCAGDARCGVHRPECAAHPGARRGRHAAQHGIRGGGAPHLTTAYCPLPTVPAAHCLLCLLPAACCLLPTAYCLLPAAYCLLPTAHCPLPTAH